MNGNVQTRLGKMEPQHQFCFNYGSTFLSPMTSYKVWDGSLPNCGTIPSSRTARTICERGYASARTIEREKSEVMVSECVVSGEISIGWCPNWVRYWDPISRERKMDPERGSRLSRRISSTSLSWQRVGSQKGIRQTFVCRVPNETRGLMKWFVEPTLLSVPTTNVPFLKAKIEGSGVKWLLSSSWAWRWVLIRRQLN